MLSINWAGLAASEQVSAEAIFDYGENHSAVVAFVDPYTYTNTYLIYGRVVNGGLTFERGVNLTANYGMDFEEIVK
jgi:hypothetical protein